MKANKIDNYGDRLTAAAEAKKAALKRFQERPAPDSPEMLERQATRKAIIEAREARNAERNNARAAEAARLAAEQRAREAEAAARAAAEAAEARKLAAEQKAARDARYAARASRRR